MSALWRVGGSMILVQTKNCIEGFHRWEEAPEQVEILRDNHRHMFEIYCQFEVTHEDRQIEIFMKQWEIEDYLHKKYGTPCDFDKMSCESIAKKLLKHFKAYEVKVLEDGDGGAIVRQ